MQNKIENFKITFIISWKDQVFIGNMISVYLTSCLLLDIYENFYFYCRKAILEILTSQVSVP